MSVSEQLAALGLEAPLCTKVAEQAAHRALAEVEMRRAHARAGHLERRAWRKPVDSNGRAKDLQQASALRAHAHELATTHELKAAA